MPRAARIVIPGCPHHVTQRGNNRQPVFFVDADREFYLSTLAEQCQRFGLDIQAYCLMENHIHLVATPHQEDSLSKAVGRTNLYYTRYINRLHRRSGHLWQDRFFSCPLGEEHFWNALVYVERNPVSAGIARCPWQYRWSSARAHVQGTDKTSLLDLAEWPSRLGPNADWRDALRQPLDEKQVKALQRWSRLGLPLGSDSWISKLETALNRRLRPNPRGRPKKPKLNSNRPG
jgi:putative transposase